MSAPEQAPRRIAELCEETIGELLRAHEKIRALQRKVEHDPWLHRELDSIDDHLHGALTRLGD